MQSIAPGEILRRYPAPGAVDVESNYFPLIEFAAPDLPWRYTPGRPGRRGELRPWLTLVVVEADADGIEYIGTSGAAGVLRVEPDQPHQLPPADETWGWAHVQSSRPFDEVAAAVEDEPAALLSRIVCPRLMKPGVRYRAALVNAFAAGVEERPSRRGRPGARSPSTSSSTTRGRSRRRPRPATSSRCASCSSRPTRSASWESGPSTSRAPGLEVDWPKTPMLVDLVGALADPGVITDDPAAGTTEFSAVVEPILDEVLGRAPDPKRPRRLRRAARRSRRRTAVLRQLAVERDKRPGRRLGQGAQPADEPPHGRRPRRPHCAAQSGGADGCGLGPARRRPRGVRRAQPRPAQRRDRPHLAGQGGAGRERGPPNLAAPLLSFMQVDGEPARKVVADSLAPVATLDRVWIRRTPRARGASASSAFVRGTRADATAVQLAAFAYQAVAAPQGAKPVEIELTLADQGRNLFSAAAVAHATGRRASRRGSAARGSPATSAATLS